MNEPSKIELTGNWREEEQHPDHIRTREPLLADGNFKQFHQVLHLPRGQYALELEYNTFFDPKPGQAISEKWNAFDGLVVDGKAKLLKFEPVAQSSCHRASCSLTVENESHEVDLSLRMANTRPLRAWIKGDFGQTGKGRLYNPVALPEGELVLAHGLPFRIPEVNVRFVPAWPMSYDTELGEKKAVWPPLVDNPVRTGVYRSGLLKDRESCFIECGGVKADAVHFLGMVHNIDIANGSWYSPRGDHGFSHFVGDRVGDIVLHWVDGEPSIVPLIFGFNLWYGQAWDMLWHYKPAPDAPEVNYDADIYGGDLRPRDDIEQAVALVDGIRFIGCASSNSRYIFSLKTEGRALRSIELRGHPDFHDYPLISGITIESNHPAENLESLPVTTTEPANLKPVDLASIKNEAYLPAVHRLQRHLYNFIRDLPLLDSPEVPEGYFGPQYDFKGAPEAGYAATYLYRNGPENASFIADSGMGCSSPVSHNHRLAQYVFGTGIWFTSKSHYGSLTNWFEAYQKNQPGSLPGRGGGWSRGIGELLRETVAFGYDKFTNSYVDSLDRALFQCANPPHWNRVVGNNYARQVRKVGETTEEGNRENDGHGICMWGRYMAYHWSGHSREWNQRHWKATAASVEWLQWQLDTDTLFPGRRIDVLFTESECAHGGYDIYSSFNCLHGLKLAIRMARELGETETVSRWEALYLRLKKGILKELLEDSDFGPIWQTDPHCDWQDHAHKMVPIHLATEGDTYTPLEAYAAGDDLDRHYLEISRNTYRYLMRDKQYNCLRMYGYGQGMMTQAALLMDEMADATKFLSLLVRYCYLPQFAGWASPEGIIVHRSGEYYLPVNIYGGQDSHLADSTKAVRLLLGIDDNDPTHLRLVPRFPSDWNSVSIREFPVLIGSQRQKLSYQYHRTEQECRFDFQTDVTVLRLSMRLGPIPGGKSVAAVRFNDTSVPFQFFRSGDSQWVWIKDLSGNSGTVEVLYKS